MVRRQKWSLLLDKKKTPTAFTSEYSSFFEATNRVACSSFAGENGNIVWMKKKIPAAMKVKYSSFLKLPNRTAPGGSQAKMVNI